MCELSLEAETSSPFAQAGNAGELTQPGGCGASPTIMENQASVLSNSRAGSNGWGTNSLLQVSL